MSGYYPVNLKIEDKKSVLPGGGRVAERKVKFLPEKDPSIMVIGPKVTSCLGYTSYKPFSTTRSRLIQIRPPFSGRQRKEEVK
jgi:hypothetical protein